MSDLVTRPPHWPHSNSNSSPSFPLIHCNFNAWFPPKLQCAWWLMAEAWVGTGRCLLTPVHILTMYLHVLISMGNVFGPQSEWRPKKFQNVLRLKTFKKLTQFQIPLITCSDVFCCVTSHRLKLSPENSHFWARSSILACLDGILPISEAESSMSVMKLGRKVVKCSTKRSEIKF